MNKPYSTQQSAIDLDEFERRLRGPEPLKPNDDPLAELARLVGSEDDRFRDLFDTPPPGQAQQSPPAYGVQDHVAPPPAPQYHQPQHAVPAVPPPPPAPGQAGPAGDFAEDEASALLREFAERMRRGGEFDQPAMAAPPPPAPPAPAAGAEHAGDYTGNARIRAGGYVPPPPPVPGASAPPRLPEAGGPQAFAPAAEPPHHPSFGEGPETGEQWVQPVVTPHPHDEGFGRAGDIRPARPAAPAPVQPAFDDWTGNGGNGHDGGGYDGAGDDYPDDVPLPPEEETGRSRKPLYLMAGAMAVMVVGIGATLAMRSGMTAGGVPTITASGDPVKVRPVESGKEKKPVRTVSLLNKPDGARPAATRVVAREEQPIDLNSVKPAPKRAGAGEQELASKVNLGSEKATRPVANTSPDVRPPSSARGYFPKPRRVRTVRVRPDGTLIPSSGNGSGDAAPAARKPNSPPTIAQLATGAPIPRSIANEGGNARSQSGGSKSKAANRATDPLSVSNIARAGEPAATDKPSESARARAARERREARRAADRRAAEARRSQANRRTAALNISPTPRAAPAASGGGNYAVQIAAPASEAAARRAAARAKSRYGALLGGYSPTIRRAVVGSRTVYRVRIQGMSRGAASSLCSRLKSKGGACFVARN